MIMSKLLILKDNFYPVLKEYIDKPFSYLEIGVFRGTSIEWVYNHIATHNDARIIGIDPWKYKYFNRHDVKDENDWEKLLEKLSDLQEKSKGKIRLIKGHSQNLINQFDKNSFDCIYIDGEHTCQSVLRDFVLSWPLLKDLGIMIFDDYVMKGNPQVRIAVDTILYALDKKCKILFRNNQVGIRKITE